jgi:hypothetical protein
MITDLIVAPIVTLLRWVVGLFPSADPRSFEYSGLGALAEAVSDLDSLIPILPLVVVFLGFVASLGVFLVIRLVVFVYSLIPAKAT